ncbi:MAG: hypothetical protein IDH49_11365 [Gammaproteobacteria bacterium]|nr:hypothetical protein [Gammaproteobacteria bacterium]
MPTAPRKELDTLLDGLKQQRDELIVQLHLAKAEARDQWEELEKKLEHLRAKTEQAGGIAEEASKDVFAALKLAAEEIQRGYERIRKTL